MKGTRFEAVSSLQQTVTKGHKAIREKTFSRAFDSFIRAGTIFSDGNNKYVKSWVQVPMSSLDFFQLT
jgi:hypothetical protein